MCLLEDSFSSYGSSANIELQNWYAWSHVLADRADGDEIIEGDRVFRRPIDTHDGLWRLRGHRQRGLDVLLSELWTHYGSLVRLQRETGPSKLIWEFDIDSLVGPFRNLEHPALDSSYGGRTKFQHCHDLKLDPEDLEEGDEILKLMYPMLDLGVLSMDSQKI